MLNALLARAGTMRPTARPQSMIASGNPQLVAPAAMPAPVAQPVATMQPQQQQPLNALINYGRPPVTATPLQAGSYQMPQPGQPGQPGQPQPAPQMAMPGGNLAGRMNALRARMGY